MGEKIVLDGNKREVVRAITKDSKVTCTKTNAPDVYVNAITKDGATALYLGDSTAIERMLTLKLYIFRTSQEKTFTGTAELDLSDV
jgi:hypothetical protein